MKVTVQVVLNLYFCWKMDGWWILNRFNLRVAMILLLFSCTFQSCSSSLHNEGLALLKFKERVMNDPFDALSSWKYNNGDGDLNPCPWFGVDCADGRVVVLNLRDLCLEGTMAPELGQLAHIKSINLRNNSFSGVIPQEIGELKELEVLDLGYNNFTGPFLSVLGNNLSLSILLVDNNNYISCTPHEIYNLKEFSKSQVDASLLNNGASRASSYSQSSTWNSGESGNIARRMLMQVSGSSNPMKAERDRVSQRGLRTPLPSPLPSLSPNLLTPAGPPLSSISITPSASISSEESPSPSPSPSELFSPSLPPVLPPTPALPPSVIYHRHHYHPSPSPSHASVPSQTLENTNKSKNHLIFVLAGVMGASLLVFVAALGFVYCQRSKVVSIKPWATGLSGQLQKAFVTGVPKLQRSELETACEDFSNIIGSLLDNTIYKGTLSSGVEIAVVSSAVKLNEDWSTNLEAQFRDKIDILSKVNHKNFVNLIGYCEEEEPFTRMMVFEYAPNGTLYEHLHIEESEHLDWAMRLRIVMGMAYCLEYMLELTQPMALRNLQSSSVYLTEDYAAKIADFSFWNEVTAAKMGSATMELLEVPSTDPETNIYDFGLILFEMITGKLPDLMGNRSLADLASVYLTEEQPLRDVMDPTLTSFREEQVKKLLEVVKGCVQPDAKQRPKMQEVTVKLKEITALGPDGATPKSSPLWWAELEILSTESG